MKPIGQFADFNKENILGNLLQSETHLKNVHENTDPNYLSCINKHFLEAQFELQELQAHEPEHHREYRDLMMRLRRLRKDNIKGIPTDEAISRIRDIRADFEKYVPGHDTEECKSCGDISDEIRRVAKSLNRGNNEELSSHSQEREDFMARMQNKGTVMQSLGGSLGAEVVDRYVSPMVPEVVPGITGKQLGNLGIGIAASAAALYGKAKKYNMAAAVLGTNLIAREIMNMIAGTVTPGAVRSVAVARNNAYRTNSVGAGKVLSMYPYGTVSGGAAQNGGLVFID